MPGNNERHSGKQRPSGLVSFLSSGVPFERCSFRAVFVSSGLPQPSRMDSLSKSFESPSPAPLNTSGVYLSHRRLSRRASRRAPATTADLSSSVDLAFCSSCALRPFASHPSCVHHLATHPPPAVRDIVRLSFVHSLRRHRSPLFFTRASSPQRRFASLTSGGSLFAPRPP